MLKLVQVSVIKEKFCHENVSTIKKYDCHTAFSLNHLSEYNLGTICFTLSRKETRTGILKKLSTQEQQLQIRGIKWTANNNKKRLKGLIGLPKATNSSTELLFTSSLLLSCASGMDCQNLFLCIFSDNGKESVQFFCLAYIQRKNLPCQWVDSIQAVSPQFCLDLYMHSCWQLQL